MPVRVVIVVIIIISVVCTLAYHWSVQRDLTKKIEKTLDSHDRSELVKIQRDIDRGKIGF